MLKRTWAEINLDNIAHNYKEIRKRLPEGCRFMGVVKADGYGHGAVAAAKLLEELGAEYLAVATIEEAAQLRREGTELPVLILGRTPPEHAAELAALGLTQEVNSAEYAEELSGALGGAELKIHVKTDTGMSRLGFTADDPLTAGETAKICALPNLKPEGIFTHLAVADELENPESRRFTKLQLERFESLVAELERVHGISFPIRHCANSAATIAWPEAHMDMVRPGLATWGLYPSPDMKEMIELRPAMSLKTVISQIKEIRPGDTVSYGRSFTAGARTKIAVIPVGYADGLPRRLSNKMEVLINGRRAKQVGRICMDMCMVDVSGIPGAAVGSEATLIGADGAEAITLDDWADELGTITYELACGISKRVPRLAFSERKGK